MTKRFGDRQRLEHMLSAVNDIITFTEGVSETDFAQDKMRQFACVRGFEILGEAANHVSADFQQTHSSMAWRNIIGMRNFAVHQYFDVRAEVILKTAQQQLPTLKLQLEQVLRALSA